MRTFSLNSYRGHNRWPSTPRWPKIAPPLTLYLGAQRVEADIRKPRGGPDGDRQVIPLLTELGVRRTKLQPMRPGTVTQTVIREPATTNDSSDKMLDVDQKCQGRGDVVPQEKATTILSRF